MVRRGRDLGLWWGRAVGAVLVFVFVWVRLVGRVMALVVYGARWRVVGLGLGVVRVWEGGVLWGVVVWVLDLVGLGLVVVGGFLCGVRRWLCVLVLWVLRRWRLVLDSHEETYGI